MAGEHWESYEDAELVVETLLGKAAAFDALVVRYRAAVLGTVLRLAPSRAVAEDICQEAFVRAFRALPKLRDPSRFAAWLQAIARREVIRHGPGETRAADHSPLDEQWLEQVEAPEQSGWEAVQRQEESEWVRQALTSLPAEFQLVLTLRYWAEMPLEQIANYLGRPLSTVKWRLHHARLLMRQRLIQSDRREDCSPATREPHPGQGANRGSATGAPKAPIGPLHGHPSSEATPSRSAALHSSGPPPEDINDTRRSYRDTATQWKQPRSPAHRAHA